MDLQQALNYRERCLICRGELTLSIFGYSNAKIEKNEQGLKIINRAPNKRYDLSTIMFNFDGTYQIDRPGNKIFNAALTEVSLSCHFCRKESAPATHNLWPSYLSSAVVNLKTKGCIYNFNLCGDGQGHYSCQLIGETIRYYDQESFYHLCSIFSDGKTTLNHGKFGGTLDDILYLSLPKADMSSVKDLDGFLKKYRLYLLFS